MACGGNCGSCGGCDGCGGAKGELTITPMEASVLLRLAQTPFLPIARKPDDETPAFREEETDDGRVLRFLERKALVTLDYDMPLANYDYDRLYPECRLRGSVALTLRGQQTVDLLEREGIEC